MVTTNAPIITLRDVRFTYDGGATWALDGVSLDIRRGERICLTGPNGSGKSTLSMVLAGLYTPQSGKIFVDNTEITEANRSAYRQLFASVFTDFHLFEKLVGDKGEDVSAELIAEWLGRLKMDEKVKIEQSRILNSKLSQGQKKRLGLLAAALENRSMLILDEWAADQDPAYRRVFYHHIIPMLQKMGKTLFIISHDDSYFEKADRLLMMKNGELSELTGLQREKASLDAITVIGEH